MPEPEIDVVVFDLGGVLIDFGGVGPMKELSGIDDDEEIWRRWLACTWVRSFEAGQCSVDEFARGVVGDWALAITPEAFLVSFRSWLAGPLPGAAELIAEVRTRAKVACLSNTNALHWAEHEGRWDLLDAFDARFLSFEMGCVKPDRAIFERAAEMLGSPADRVLFLDDNTINVEGARAAGWHAMRAVGVSDARTCLVRAGVLADL